MTILRVTVNVSLPDNVIGNNIFFWSTVPDVGPGDELFVAADIQDALVALYQTIDQRLHDTVNIVDFVCEARNPVTDSFNFFTSGIVNVPGTVGGDALANGIGALVELGLAGTARTAKKYIAGLAETGTNDNNLASAALLDFLAFATLWALDYVSGGGTTYIAGIWSFTDAIFKSANGSSFANSLMAYQRRRKPVT